MGQQAANVAGNAQYASFSWALAGVLVVFAAGVAPAAAEERSPLAPQRSVAAPKLDLRVGDVRRLLPPTDWAQPLPADLDEIIIRSRKTEPDIAERKAVPQGLGGLFWAATRPTEAWRLLVPDPNQPPVPPRSGDDPKEPPGAHRVRIGEPGRIF